VLCGSCANTALHQRAYSKQQTEKAENQQWATTGFGGSPTHDFLHDCTCQAKGQYLLLVSLFSKRLDALMLRAKRRVVVPQNAGLQHPPLGVQ